jgi:hypothetical protein
MKLVIYHGTVTPFKAVGKNQCNLLDFAFRHQNWHSYSNDKSTLNAVKALVARNCIIINQNNQFKINLGA